LNTVTSRKEYTIFKGDDRLWIPYTPFLSLCLEGLNEHILGKETSKS